ncbi:NmrA family NAD(P)-binding protein [Nonomuraea aurantiaca]|uniref:NmrA family NAD(P)-binding protein n=1 Tax=Nonomuraea aurantiaca TaxID=2878562 RepID=UPI001CD9F0BD|nr:NmrA family NAD(P)-binding protein [Nonomuraea aurantiaca]
MLVTGATGREGGATARALLRAGTDVHALVRDPTSPRAQEIAAHGATLVTGDLEDPASLLTALDGARDVFSMQMPDLADLMGDSEVRYAGNLAAAAQKAGVEQIVHTSVSGAGQPRSSPRSAESPSPFPPTCRRYGPPACAASMSCRSSTPACTPHRRVPSSPTPSRSRPRPSPTGPTPPSEHDVPHGP